MQYNERERMTVQEVEKVTMEVEKGSIEAEDNIGGREEQDRCRVGQYKRQRRQNGE